MRDEGITDSAGCLNCFSGNYPDMGDSHRASYSSCRFSFTDDWRIAANGKHAYDILDWIGRVYSRVQKGEFLSQSFRLAGIKAVTFLLYNELIS